MDLRCWLWRGSPPRLYLILSCSFYLEYSSTVTYVFSYVTYQIIFNPSQCYLVAKTTSLDLYHQYDYVTLRKYSSISFLIRWTFRTKPKFFQDRLVITLRLRDIPPASSVLLYPCFHLIPVAALSNLRSSRHSWFLKTGITWSIVCITLDVLSQSIQTIEHMACRLICWNALVDFADPGSKSLLQLSVRK